MGPTCVDQCHTFHSDTVNNAIFWMRSNLTLFVKRRKELN